jgi:AcrB/AcrD/AcrF family protein
MSTPESMVSFARDRLNQGATPLQAAHDAGFTRFRPVLMTALAMIVGGKAVGPEVPIRQDRRDRVAC